MCYELLSVWVKGNEFIWFLGGFCLGILFRWIWNGEVKFNNLGFGVRFEFLFWFCY